MQTRYFIGAGSLIYVGSVAWSTTGHAIAANEICMLISIVMIPFMVHGARHQSKRHPEVRKDVTKFSYIMVAWLLFAFVFHTLGVFEATPQSSVVYAFVPMFGLLALMVGLYNLGV